jgi:hypothetical protein
MLHQDLARSVVPAGYASRSHSKLDIAASPVCAAYVVEMTAASRRQAGTCTRPLMCLRFTTMVNVITTSSDHELHLPTWTAVHAPS